MVRVPAAYNTSFEMDVECGSSNPNPAPPYSPQTQPPAYDANTYPSETPPSYESVLRQINAAKEESSGALDYLRKILLILVGTIGCTIMVGLILSVPISMVVIGSIYIYDCDAEKYIPIYLVVSGAFYIIQNLYSLAGRVKKYTKWHHEEEDDEREDPKHLLIIKSLINCFLFIWFITGNIWIYGIYDGWQSDTRYPEEGMKPYCDATLYWYSFWLLTASYALAGFMCLCGCVALIGSIFCSLEED